MKNGALIRVLAVILTAMLLSSCDTSDNSSAYDSDYHSKLQYFDTPKPKKTDPVITFEEFVPEPMKTKVWAEKKIKHVFSDPAQPDIFHLQIAGDQYYSALVYFFVYKADGTQIFADSFPYTDMLSIAFE